MHESERNLLASLGVIDAQSDWWKKMSPEQQQEYIKTHPKTKMKPTGPSKKGPGKELTAPSQPRVPKIKTGPADRNAPPGDGGRISIKVDGLPVSGTQMGPTYKTKRGDEMIAVAKDDGSSLTLSRRKGKGWEFKGIFSVGGIGDPMENARNHLESMGKIFKAQPVTTSESGEPAPALSPPSAAPGAKAFGSDKPAPSDLAGGLQQALSHYGYDTSAIDVVMPDLIDALDGDDVHEAVYDTLRSEFGKYEEGIEDGEEDDAIEDAEMLNEIAGFIVQTYGKG